MDTSAYSREFTEWALKTEVGRGAFICSAGMPGLASPCLIWCFWLTQSKTARQRKWFGFGGHSAQSRSEEGFVGVGGKRGHEHVFWKSAFTNQRGSNLFIGEKSWIL